MEEDIYSKLDFDWKTELADLSECSPNEFTFMIENEKFPDKKELSISEIKAYKKIFLIFKSLVEFQIKNYDSIYNFVEKKNNKLPSFISPITKTSQIKENELENYLLYTCKTRELHPLLENQAIMARESMDRILQLKRNNLTRDINSASNIEHYDFKFIEPLYAQGQLKKKLEFAKKKLKEFQN